MKTCERCGKPFEPTSSSMRNKNYQGRWCSRLCANSARKAPIADRFWSKVARTEDGEGCWLWTAARDKDGYGLITLERGNQRVAHRVAYELEHGVTLQPGEQVCHRCDNPPCCNPAHLFVGTVAVNMADRDAKGRNYHGTRHHRAKVTEAEVLAIRWEYSKGASQQAIASQYGISQVSVSAIVRRKTWSHVP